MGYYKELLTDVEESCGELTDDERNDVFKLSKRGESVHEIIDALWVTRGVTECEQLEAELISVLNGLRKAGLSDEKILARVMQHLMG